MSDRQLANDALPSGGTLTICILSLALFVGALLPRIANLGDLSFYADEDLSALTASAMSTGEGSVLPSGMEYRRAVPFTWLNSLSIRLFGEASEFALRFPAALLGALTTVGLFLLGRRFVGTGAGLTAAVLLAVSEWHLVFSRQSRMYAALVLFVVLALWGLWSWARTGKRWAFVGGMAATLIAIALHRLGLLLTAAPVLWLAFPGALGVPVGVLLAAAGAIAVTGFAIAKFWIEAPYEIFPMPPEVARLQPLDPPPEVASLGIFAFLLAAIGVALAIILARRVDRRCPSEPGDLLRRLGIAAFVVLTGLAAGSGQVHAFAVCGAIALLLLREGARPLIGLPLAGLLALLALHLALWTPQVGFVEALKVGSVIPYPHANTLLSQAPAPTILFGLTALTMILFPYDEEKWGMAVATTLAAAMLAAIGLVRGESPTRYLLTAYPLIILVAGAGLYLAIRWVVKFLSARQPEARRWIEPVSTLVAVSLVLGGAVSGHGFRDALRLARLEHGEAVNELVHVYPFRPDHRSVGLALRELRRGGDLVVAEDPIMQHWYAGEVDFWFRRYGDMRRYLRVRGDGVMRDIYVGSQPMPEPARLDSLAAAHPNPVWLITSGETLRPRRQYFTPDQIAWLDSLSRARAPLHVGEDGVSRLYCLNCDEDGGTVVSPDGRGNPTARSSTPAHPAR